MAPLLDRTMLDLARDKFVLPDLHTRLTAKKTGKKGGKTKSGGWAIANSVIEKFSTLYDRAAGIEDDLPANPTKRRVKLNPKADPRNTAVKDKDLPGWWTGVQQLTPQKRAYWLVLLLTGGRRGQMAAAEWEHIDLTEETWTFPDANVKMRQGYSIPISKFLAQFLREWKRCVDTEDEYEGRRHFVFPSPRQTGEGHIQAPRSQPQGVKVSAHALRHTFGTSAVTVGLTEIESKLLMGHKFSSTNMSQRYVTRKNVEISEAIREKQEAMTQRYLKLLNLTGADIKHITCDEVKPGE